MKRVLPEQDTARSLANCEPVHQFVASNQTLKKD
jgi:hypothetical protein